MKHKILFSLLFVMVSLLPGWSQITTMHATLSGIGIKSLNGLTAKSQTFATGTTGTDFNISSSGTVHTFNIPTASATNRGLLSTADWTTFNNKFTLPAFTSGSVIFSNGMTLVQDNPNFFWDDTNNRLGIGTTAPAFSVDILNTSVGSASGTLGLQLQNNTAAAAGAQQYSPSLVWKGQGWKTDAVAASQPVEFYAFVEPVQGAGGPSGKWVLRRKINGVSPSEVFSVTSSGAGSFPSSVSAVLFTGRFETATGGIGTNFTAFSNFTNSDAGGLVGSASTHYRCHFGGFTTSTMTANLSAASVIFGASAATIAASGTHPLFANVAIKAMSITAGAGTLTNGATLYLEGASTAATNNYTLWSDAGNNRLDGSTGIGGVTTPTSLLHLAAGTASASTAPLKLTSGTNLTTAEAGAVEYDGTEFYATNSGASRTILSRCLKGSATLDFGSTAAQSSADLTITVNGAADGDPVYLGAPNGSVNANTSFFAWVSNANTVSVRFNNYSSGAVDPASGTFKVTVNK